MKSERAFIATPYGRLSAHAFEGRTGRRSAVLIFGNLAQNKDEVVIRIQSACLTSTVLGSLLCDCRQQIEQAFEILASTNGVFIYLDDEGRGHGLVEKIGQFNEQNQGADTVDAALRRGVEPDVRDYAEACETINEVVPGRSIRLLTNNPLKIAAVRGAGINVLGRLPLETLPTDQNRSYLMTKRDRLGHLLTLPEGGG